MVEVQWTLWIILLNSGELVANPLFPVYNGFQTLPYLQSQYATDPAVTQNNGIPLSSYSMPITTAFNGPVTTGVSPNLWSSIDSSQVDDTMKSLNELLSTSVSDDYYDTKVEVAQPMYGSIPMARPPGYGYTADAIVTPVLPGQVLPTWPTAPFGNAGAFPSPFGAPGSVLPNAPQPINNFAQAPSGLPAGLPSALPGVPPGPNDLLPTARSLSITTPTVTQQTVRTSVFPSIINTQPDFPRPIPKPYAVKLLPVIIKHIKVVKKPEIQTSYDYGQDKYIPYGNYDYQSSPPIIGEMYDQDYDDFQPMKRPKWEHEFDRFTRRKHPHQYRRHPR